MADRRAVNRSMFWRVIRRSLFANRGRLLVILLALGAGSAVTAALLNLQVDAKRRIATEFRAFGPNVLVVPRSTDGAARINESLLEQLETASGGAEFAATPYLYLVSQIQSENQKRESIVAGTHLDSLENREPGWKLQPQHPSPYAPDECVVGVRLADQMKAHAKTALRLNANGRVESCTVAAVLSSGGAEDDQVFMSLGAGQRLAGESGRINMAKLFVGGDAARINQAIANLQAKFPDVEVRPVRQFTEGEARLYSK